MTIRRSIVSLSIPVLVLVLLLPGLMAEDPSAAGQLTIERPEPETAIDPRTSISVSGTHSLPADSHVWIFLRDIYGGYYLQNPPAELFKGKWEQTNTRPLTGIRYIIAIQVDSEGHRKLKSWVNREAPRFGKIDVDEVKGLPGYRELDRVAIVTPR